MESTRVLPPVDQRIVPIFEHIARTVGRPLDRGWEILDFGAGAGRHVAEFREAGYEAIGVDRAHRSHEAGSVESEFLRTVEAPDYRLPMPDGSFDFVYSTSVMEHVIEPGSALAEIARVLRPGGLSIHAFPSRWRPVEPHMFTPFGGRVQNYWANRTWAALGVRNQWQQGMGAREVALRNTQYGKSGISYPSATEWELRAGPLFEGQLWAERPYIEATAAVSGISRRLGPLLDLPGLERVYRTFHTRVLVLKT